jgi:hypothetical protein
MVLNLAVIGLAVHHPLEGDAIGAGSGLVVSYIDRIRRSRWRRLALAVP